MLKLKSLASFTIAKLLVSASQHSKSLKTVYHHDASDLEVYNFILI